MPLKIPNIMFVVCCLIFLLSSFIIIGMIFFFSVCWSKRFTDFGFPLQPIRRSGTWHRRGDQGLRGSEGSNLRLGNLSLILKVYWHSWNNFYPTSALKPDQVGLVWNVMLCFSPLALILRVILLLLPLSRHICFLFGKKFTRSIIVYDSLTISGL